MDNDKPEFNEVWITGFDAVHAPLTVHSHEWMDPAYIRTHPALQFREGADKDTGKLYDLDDEAKSLYDVDKGGCLTCWRSNAHETYVVDGHHRLNLAKTAKHFVSSKLAKGKHIPVERKVPIRVLHEKDGWTPELARRQGEALNAGSRGVKVNPAKTSEEEADLLARGSFDEQNSNRETIVEPNAEKTVRGAHDCQCGGTCDHWKTLADSEETGVEVEVEVEELTFDSYEVLAGDSTRGILCRLRQYAAQADSRNRNKRRYPGAVLADAIAAALPDVRSGVMLSEFDHPRPVRVCDSTGCIEKFPDNLERKTAGIDDIELPDAKGRVHIRRSIRDTKFGRVIHGRVLRKEPVPVSMRFIMKTDRALSDSETTVAKHIRILGFDDVARPAVDGAGEYTVLADGIEEPMQLVCDDADEVADEVQSEYAAAFAAEEFFKANGFVEVDAYYASTPNEHVPEATEETLEAGLGDPAQFLSNNTSNPEIQPEKVEIGVERGKGSASADRLAAKRSPPITMEPTNMQNILSLQRRFSRELKSGATVPALDAINKEWAQAILDAYNSDPAPDVREYVQTYQRVMLDSEIAGFSGSRSGPYAVMGNELGDDPMGGWGKDTKVGKTAGESELTDMGTSTKATKKQVTMAHEKGGAIGDEVVIDEATARRNAHIDALLARDEAEKVEKARVDSVIEALKLATDETHPYSKLSEDMQKVVWDEVIAQAKDATDVVTLLDSKMAFVSRVATDATARARGLHGLATGNTVDDAANLLAQRSAVVHEDIPGFSVVKKMLALSDQYVESRVQAYDLFLDPRDPNTKALRAYTHEMFQPTLRAMVKMHGGASLQSDEWHAGSDSLEDEVEQHLLDTLAQISGRASMDSLATTTSVLYNQPTILMYMAIQAFQDLRAAQFVKVFGPGSTPDTAMGMPGFQDLGAGIGTVFRVPYESYTDPGGTGFHSGTADGGLFTTEGAEIQAGTVDYSWRSFAPVDRAIATTMSLKGILTMGKGPLNLSVVTRNLLHMAARKCRTIDTAIQNEMSDIAFEYGAVVVTAESYTTGNSYLPDNSVYLVGGSVTINLNPAKTAVATVVASTDKYAIYGSTVVSAIRLVTGGSATAAPYVGTNGYAPNPIVRPRTTADLNAAGAITSTTTNPFTITAPAAQVPGLYAGGTGGDNQIHNDGSGTTATYAVDWINGVLLFNTASTVAGAAGVVTTTVTVTYSYATNFDYFPASTALATPLFPANGGAPKYYDGLLTQIDRTAANMGSDSKFVKPDLLLMTLLASPYITGSDLFYKFNSPDGTSLFPDETYYFQRTGVRAARTNAPILISERSLAGGGTTTGAMLLTRNHTSFYGLDTPFFVSPPIYPQGTTPLPIAGAMFYGYERSVIGTIQSQDTNGNVLNPVGRVILLF